MADEKRKFERHDLDIPIIISLDDVVHDAKDYLNNISLGGLSFKSSCFIENGTIIDIKIPLIRPLFQARGKVVWCKKNGDHYDVGATFTGIEDAFKLRMVEQVCHIEKYKKELYEKEKRELTGEQAAIEWIKKYAAHFPGLKEYKKKLL